MTEAQEDRLAAIMAVGLIMVGVGGVVALTLGAAQLFTVVHNFIAAW